MSRIARLIGVGANAGKLDTSFNPGTGANGPVNIIAMQIDGKILMGANYQFISGHWSNYLARLINTDPSTQSLSFNGPTITWLRGGTAPEAWRTSFETSTDGATWTDLGPGTRISGGWQLSGLSLPANSIIRARAFITGGLRNGSSWFVQSHSRPLILLNDGNFGFRSNQLDLTSLPPKDSRLSWKARPTSRIGLH